MIHEKIEIRAAGYPHTAELYTYFLGRSEEMRPQRKRPLVLICPGGGYVMTSDREAEPVAMQFLARGYHTAVLRYSVSPAVYPEALLQVGTAVAWLKAHAEEYGIDPERIIVMGFSAGGHLAGSYGVFWRKPFVREAIGTEEEMLRPAGLILCYPVITSGEKAHRGSFEALLAEKLEERKEEVSLEKQVSEDVPPVFLWHTMEDDCVPVENSLLFYQALLEKKIPAELHIFPYGGHGLSLANEETMTNEGYGVQKACQSWISLAEEWMKTLGSEA